MQLPEAGHESADATAADLKPQVIFIPTTADKINPWIGQYQNIND